jgi:tRNA threonylcarbamoyladenosine modification (KEOPS) complex  Pcc1 subunit
MSDAPPGWVATVTVRAADPRLAGMLERALRPEAAREVPRARATLGRGGPREVTLEIEARDTGAMRAALNTYLGWVHLALETVRRGRATGSPEGTSPA